jgi:hypothetical protein
MKGSKESHAIVPFNICVYARSSVIFSVLLVRTDNMSFVQHSQKISSIMARVINILLAKENAPLF